MKTHFTLLSLAALICFSLPAAAEVDPAKLVKVTAGNNAKCVEYYTFKGEMYCSTTAQHSTPIDSHIKDSETQIIQFDDRPWQATWGKKTPNITTIEYVPAGDDINAWHELITSQYLPGLQAKATPEQYADFEIQNLKDAGFYPIVTFLEKTPDRELFEFRIEYPENQKQDELQLITKGQKGLYILHYVIKDADMGQTNRDKWVTNLKNSNQKN